MSEPSIYVYLVEQGCYSDRGIVGVYATPEAAMAAHPVPVRQIRNGGGTREREGGWKPSTYAEPGYEWSNGLDWEDAKTITRHEVEQGEPRESLSVLTPAHRLEPSVRDEYLGITRLDLPVPEDAE